MHKTRENISKLWPIQRKGTKYIIIPSHNPKTGIPLLIVMREILGIVKTRKELKKIILEKKVLVNNKLARNENISLCLFDTLSLKELGKYYKIDYSEKKKIILKEINEKDTESKICKIIGKKIIKGNKVQVNFNDGRNFLVNEKINIGDSAIVNFNAKKIGKIMPIKESSEAIVIRGKYLGQTGKIAKIEGKNAEIKLKDKKIMINLNNFIILN